MSEDTGIEGEGSFEIVMAPVGYQMLSANPDHDEGMIYAIPVEGLHPVKWYDVERGGWVDVVYSRPGEGH